MCIRCRCRIEFVFCVWGLWLDVCIGVVGDLGVVRFVCIGKRVVLGVV